MRIARPRRPTAVFKRKRSPPPQATKLIRYSMVAGIVFIVLLAVVFLPRMFVNQMPVATPVKMAITTSATSTRLDVTSVGALVPLSNVQAVLVRDNTTIGILGPPLGGGNATLAFTDADGDGRLSPGDFFMVTTRSTACNYRLDINQMESGSTFVVGQQDWGFCYST
ncbi:MAG: hypothetical protein E6K12_03885 [Methanobacteriota archaeon]|nr:MAG: hypothetical protein E6K15_00720 [Euryarchaeota archaeon]TLZ67293.1 MAG: hypothetical protein E6K12_03885 [Euryarchaeota archaeon]